MSDHNCVIKGGRIVQLERVIQADIRIENGIITEIGSELSGTMEIKAKGHLILPGFVDIHNHGSAGFDFSFGQYQVTSDTFLTTQEALENGLKNALDFYLSKGVTKVYLTSMAAPLEKLTQAFSQLNDRWYSV